jgi:hypothetical protein
MVKIKRFGLRFMENNNMIAPLFKYYSRSLENSFLNQKTLGVGYFPKPMLYKTYYAIIASYISLLRLKIFKWWRIYL